MLSALSPDKYLAILIAAIAGFAFGAVWYGLLGRQWMSARGLSEAEAKARTGASPVPFIVSFIALLIMALMLSGVLVHLALGGMPSRRGPERSRGFCCGSGSSSPPWPSTTPSRASGACLR